MFRGERSTARDPLLPTPANERYGGGGSLYGAAKKTRRNLPKSFKSFIATVVWALASMGLTGWGWRYYARSAESSTFTCSHYMCKFEDKKGDTVELTSIPRARLVRADMVRVRNGEIVTNYTKLKREIQRKLGYTYAIVYMEPDSEDDDDASYDSYEDDDSYDGYDNEEDSSADEGDGEGKKPSRVSQEEKAAARRGAEERAKYTRERDEKRKRDGRPPLREPDEPRRMTPEMFAQAKEDGEQDDQDDRFPGDAGTMKDKYRDKAAFPSQADMRQKAKADMETRGRERNRNTSPDDPDNKPPSPKLTPEMLARIEKEDGGHDDQDDRFPGDAGTMEEKYRNKDHLTNQGPEEAGNLETRNGGGRKTSSVGGMEELEESLQDLNIDKDDVIGVDTGGGAGSRRKLFATKPVKKDVSPPSRKRTRREIEEDAKRARENHRQGHGHHNKKARNVARTRTLIEEGEAEELGEEDAAPPAKTVHHHKGFHHTDMGYVPEEARHHVHPGYHHRSGEEKVKGGWRHEDRQWHGHSQLKILGTRFSLGRSRARERKQLIDKYARKEIHKVQFTDSNAGGVRMMALGFLSLVFCLLVGNFQP